VSFLIRRRRIVAVDWITDEIAIGDWREAQNADQLRHECVWSLLSLIGMFVGRSAESLGVQRVEFFPLQDGPGDTPARFAAAVELLARLVHEGPPVLVHCRAGRSRSAAVVAGFLMRSCGWSAEEAVAFVASRRAIELNPEMAALVRQFTPKGGERERRT
jgi:atypical dual specificity phosphatase